MYYGGIPYKKGSNYASCFSKRFGLNMISGLIFLRMGSNIMPQEYPGLTNMGDEEEVKSKKSSNAIPQA